MKRLHTFAVIALVVVSLTGCAMMQAATPPQPSTPEQAWLLATHETKAMMAAANDALEQELISADTHLKIEGIVIEARTGLLVAKQLLKVDDMSGAQAQIRLVTSLIYQARTLIGGEL